LPLAAGFTAGGQLRAAVLHPRVVVVAMFEIGADTGDAPGEFQFWVEREHLDQLIPVAGAYHGVRANADGSVIAIVTGAGNINAAATIMALGYDPHFDLSRSYWLVAGIAGIDPNVGSLGSAAWAEYVVDGDLAHEIDAREMPADWTTGRVPLGKTKPYEGSAQPPYLGVDQVFHLNPALVHWAFNLTRDTPLADNPRMKARRETYVGYPNALRPPFVLIGDNLAASTYWHGARLNAWAEEWVKYHTGGQGHFATSAMEDTGTLEALTRLTHAGRADVQRALVLRTASNFDMQWPGGTASESMSGEKNGVYTAYRPSLEAAYLVGSRVVHALVKGDPH